MRCTFAMKLLTSAYSMLICICALILFSAAYGDHITVCFDAGEVVYGLTKYWQIMEATKSTAINHIYARMAGPVAATHVEFEGGLHNETVSSVEENASSATVGEAQLSGNTTAAHSDQLTYFLFGFLLVIILFMQETRQE